MKKHILLFLDYYLPHRGGVETVFEQIIQKLSQRSYHITLITSHFDKQLPFYEVVGNIEIYRVGFGRFSFLFFGFLKGFSLLKKKKYDILHASTYIAAFPASLLAFFFRKKIVLTVHEVFGKLWILYKGWFLGRLFLFLEKILFLLPYTKYHCVSLYTMNSLRLLYRIPDHKLFVAYNGIDYSFWNQNALSSQSLSDWKKKYGWYGRFVVLYYGHTGKSKGLDTLIDCVPQMISYDPTVLFVFNLIDSKRKSLLLNRIRSLQKLGFSRQIQIFEGVDKKDLRIMVASCNLVVAPSFSEGFGSVHTESVAMGKPLITTNIASLPEVLGGQVVFIQPGSSQQLLEAILFVKNNEKKIPFLPDKFFDREKTIDILDHVYMFL